MGGGVSDLVCGEMLVALVLDMVICTEYYCCTRIDGVVGLITVRAAGFGCAAPYRVEFLVLAKSNCFPPYHHS